MLAQTAVILFLSFWAVEEYLNNNYFQAYLNGLFGGNGFTAIVLISILAFVVIVMALYSKLRRSRKELEALLSAEKAGSDGRVGGQVLDNRTEQHLIEMIRKTMPMKEGDVSG